MARHAKYTDEQILAQIEAHGLTYIKYAVHGKSRFLYCNTPSGIEWRCQISHWCSGGRPPATYMGDNIKEQAQAFGLSDVVIKDVVIYGDMQKCVTGTTPSGIKWQCRLSEWVNKGNRPKQWMMYDSLSEAKQHGLIDPRLEQRRFEHSGRLYMHLIARTPCGIEYAVPVTRWIKGQRPPPYMMRDLKEEVEACGYTWNGFIKKPHAAVKTKNGVTTATFMSMTLPNGYLYEVLPTLWMKGHRPDRRCGIYSDSLFEKLPNLRDESGDIYYRKFTNHDTGETFYKIGIAVNSNNRFSAKSYDYDVTLLHSERMNLFDAYHIEQWVKDLYKASAHRPMGTMHGGYTECFSTDVLGYDAA
jgi:hypothetical protein